MIPAIQLRVLRASTSALGLGQAIAATTTTSVGARQAAALVHCQQHAGYHATSSAPSPATPSSAPRTSSWALVSASSSSSSSSSSRRAPMPTLSKAAAVNTFSSTSAAAGNSQRSSSIETIGNTAVDNNSNNNNNNNTTTAASVYNNEANPPATTRPPPLELPARSPHISTFQHLLATGKAYLAFYKTGLVYLWANTKAVFAQQQAGRRSAVVVHRRSDFLLYQRWRHDMRLMPVFGLLLLVCGELTPLVVMVFPHLVPYPCRIPRQVDKLRRQTEARRHASFVQLQAQAQAGQVGPQALGPVYAHIARSLGLVSPMWDRLGLIAVPGLLARARVHRRLQFLAEDDGLLRAAGGAAALEAEEVRLACADRGVDVRDVDETQLRGVLAEWLERTRAADRAASAVAEVAGGSVAATARTTEVMVTDAGVARRVELLARRPNDWPAK